MAEYKGVISGYGNAEKRENEISSDSVASLRRFIIGKDYGVLSKDDSNDDCFEPVVIDTNRVQFNGGYVYAYGYIGNIPNPTVFVMILGAIPQYYFAYVEIDKSVIPNTCTIKMKNNQNSPYMNDYTFRQDELSSIKTGVHQTPICLLRTSVDKGIEIVENYISGTERKYNPNPPFENTVLYRICKVNFARNPKKIVGNIERTVVLSDENFSVGNNLSPTKYVDMRVEEEVNRSINI